MTHGFKKSRILECVIKYLPGLLFILTLIGTLFAAYYAHQIAQQEHRDRFNAVRDTVTEALKSRFTFYENTLKQTGAYFMHGQKISAEDFKVYVHNIGLVSRYPGMTAIGYAEYVPAEKFKAFVRDRRREGQKSYDIWPLEVGRAFYTPVKYVEPFFRLVRELRGFDMVHSPRRRNAMVKAAAEGEPTVTEELELFVTEVDSSPQGFNIFIPVYNSKTEPPNRSARIRRTQGYVFGVFSGEHLFNIIFKENNLFKRQAGVKVFLAADSGNMTKVYDSDVLYSSEETQSTFEEEVRISMGNKEWVFQIRSLVALESNLTNNLRWIVLSFGTLLAFSFLLFTQYIQKVNRQLEQSSLEHKRLAQSNSLLYAAGKTLGSTLDTTIMLKRFAAFFTENFCDCCLIHILGSDSFRPELEATSVRKGSSSSCEEAIEAYSGAGHIMEYVIRENRTLYQRESRDLGKKSFVAIPLVVKGKVFGIVSLLYGEKKDLPPQEISLIEQSVTAAATNIENSLLYKETQVSSRLKDEFLAVVSHELRTPLTVILGYSRLLLKRIWPPDVEKAITNISRAAENQGTLIEDLLDVSAIISGKVKFRPTAVSVPEIIHAAIENVQLASLSKHIKIYFAEHEDCKILGEKVRLQQIVWNLLSNSVKFTPKGGEIQVSYEVANQHCEIQVRDTGKGIEPDFLPYVFEKFRQEEKTSTRTKGGLGLGLSIVKSLVELHGGTVSVFSEGRGTGATFTARFPLISAQSTIEANGHSEIENSLQDVLVLIVDNDAATLDLISRILKGFEAVVFTASSVQDALKILQEEAIDVVISELSIPGKDGIDFVREVRQREQESRKHLPMLVLSARVLDQTRAEALEEGFDLFLAKPVKAEELVNTVNRLISH